MNAKLRLSCVGLFLLYNVDAVLAADQGASACASTIVDRTVPQEIASHLNEWWWMANTNRSIQIVLGLVGLISSLFLSAFTDQMSPRDRKIAAFIAALSFGVLGAFDVGGKADSARNGWRHLNVAILKFQNDPCYTKDDLIEAYSEGETLLGNVSFNSQGGASAPSSPPDANHKHE
jgi:hypothetical protein